MNNKTKLAFLALILIITAVLPVTNNSSSHPPPLTVRGGGEGSGVTIEARSALVFDLLTGEILFEKNIYEPLPLASLTKIISSLVVADHIDLNELIKIKKSEYLRAEDLLAKAMGESSNDAMMALVEHFGDEKWFLELMRQKAKELGAKKMSFLNPTGLDIKLSLGQSLTQTKFGAFETASNFGSARDLSQIVKNSLDSIIWQVGNKEGLKYTNLLRGEISGIVGAKTGFTDNAGGNLVLIVEHPLGKPKLIVILGSTILGRFEDAKALLALVPNI